MYMYLGYLHVIVAGFVEVADTRNAEQQIVEEEHQVV